MGHRYKTCFKDRSKIWDAFLKFNENFFLSFFFSFFFFSHSFLFSLSLFHLFSLSSSFHDSFLTQVVCQRIIFFILHSVSFSPPPLPFSISTLFPLPLFHSFFSFVLYSIRSLSLFSLPSSFSSRFQVKGMDGERGLNLW